MNISGEEISSGLMSGVLYMLKIFWNLLLTDGRAQFFALVVLLAVVVNAILSSAKVKGRIGEAQVNRELKLVNRLNMKGKTLRNIYVPKNTGETTEIDLLYITSKGLIVIESKNYNGYIFGTDVSKEWTVTLNKGKTVEKIRFFNPVLQNKGHIKYLKQYLNQDVPAFSIIVFANSAQLKEIHVSSPNTYVCNTEDLYRTVKRIRNDNPDILNEKEADEIYNMLLPLTKADAATKQKHIEDVKAKKTAPVKVQPEPAPESELPADICPKCGGKLILRTVKSGSNAGKQFYGCENFPRCRYTRKTE